MIISMPGSLLACRNTITALVLALVLGACGGRVELLSQVDEAQANEVLAALLKRDIGADKVSGKEGLVSVRVDQAKVADAIGIMQSQGLPRVRHARMGEVFKKEGLISSPLEERARMVYALSQELAGTISHIDGVITAEVHVVLPERAGFGEPGNPSSAAVFIKHQDTAPIKQVVPQIRRLVANSISGLSYERVSVVLVPSGVTVDSTAPATETVWGLVAVSAAEAPRLRMLLGLLGLALALAAGTLCFLWRKRTQQQAPNA